jgi:hypothetical protein
MLLDWLAIAVSVLLSDSVPAQLHVKVQAAANDVQVVVDEAREGTTPSEIDDTGSWARKRQNVFASADPR